ncbi:MarR family winged helix-turn-helix transcriptional regulator [Kineosporia sp. R_H_3]|uniref:MarR family winged helix-turn-helix transcriptional regulator n=1 Tax=Kineosporia sp. R_H_3 TaxID=1961848 RepID=UPI00117A566A|nr:MarR family winged helix-turn-helix transcriptional regulator [Kineosporia sp. R_H_3]
MDPVERPAACPATADAPLTTQVHEAFLRLVHRQRLLLQRVLSRHELHPGQAMCLRVLAQRDGVSQRDIAETLMLSAPTVTRMLQRMERSGLVERASDPDDARQTVVRLTPVGTGLQALVDSALTEFLDRSLARLPEQDLRDLARLMTAWCGTADLEDAVSAPFDPDPDSSGPVPAEGAP